MVANYILLSHLLSTGRLRSAAASAQKKDQINTPSKLRICFSLIYVAYYKRDIIAHLHSGALNQDLVILIVKLINNI
jgi:hypothetical protein